MCLYLVIESVKKGDKIHGIYTSLPKAKKRCNQILKKRTYLDSIDVYPYQVKANQDWTYS